MNSRISRREFTRLAAAGASAAVLGGLTMPASAQTRLRLIWWGNPDRDRRTNEVIDLYMKQNPDVAIDPETYAWNDYWPKLATQAAGRNLPDVIQMDYRYIFEYARRGQLADLTPLVGSQIDLSDFDPKQLESGKVDGKLFGISMGANSMTHVYKPAMLKELGLELPDPTKWTNDDYVAMGKEVKAKLPEGVYFSENMAYREPRLETWVRQRGKALYTADGKLGYDLEDLEEYFAFWFQMQEDGLTPPADLQSQAIASGKMEDTMFVTKHVVFDFIHSNQMVAVQKLVPEEVSVTMIPNQKDGKPGPVPEALDADLHVRFRGPGGGRQTHGLLHNRRQRERHPSDRARRDGRCERSRAHPTETLGNREEDRRLSRSGRHACRRRCPRRRRRMPASSTARCSRPGSRSPSRRWT